MNQGVQILDGYKPGPDADSIVISAMVSGLIVSCLITDIEVTDVAEFYQQYQFDIEDYLENLLSDLDGDIDGDLIITAEDLI